MQIFSCEGNIVDIQKRTIFWGRVHVSGERITEIEVLGEEKRDKNYLMPGFVDAHVHIESSMLTPANFARMAVCHGTVGTVSDPHEIANVLGVEGVEYMIDNGKQVPFNFAFGAPSCVPATVFETAGATIDSLQVADLLSKPEIKYLAEMMNYPGVIYNDPEVMAKLHAAHIAGKPIDGHAPGLIGEDAIQYFSQNISTDHECYEYEEAKFKLSLGVKILIREGSAAKNFKTLIPLAHDHWENMMFCSDDKHPDDLILGHINLLVARAIKEEKLDLFKALTMACINPVVHYQLQIGQLRKQDYADFIMVKDLLSFEVITTYIKGKKVAEYGQSQIPAVESKIVNHFEASPVNKSILSHPIAEQIRVIHAHDGQLITSSAWLLPKVLGDECVSDVERDLLKIVVYNRYSNCTPAIAFIQGFGLKSGALASSVAHDSHNIIGVGVDDDSLAIAINSIIEAKGGVVATDGEQTMCLPLPIAGLMSDLSCEIVGSKYGVIDAFAKEGLESSLSAPFMTLSFMALLVIPELKLSDLGLFDGKKFEFVT